jgi:hemoglobin
MASIYNQIGGAPAVAAAVEDFYARVTADDLLAPYFKRTDMRRQKAHMRAFLATALGGAEIYRGRDMDAAHAGLGITHAAFDRVVEHLVATLTSLGVDGAIIEAIGAKLAPLRAAVVTEARAEAA